MNNSAILEGCHFPPSRTHHPKYQHQRNAVVSPLNQQEVNFHGNQLMFTMDEPQLLYYNCVVPNIADVNSCPVRSDYVHPQNVSSMTYQYPLGPIVNTSLPYQSYCSNFLPASLPFQHTPISPAFSPEIRKNINEMQEPQKCVAAADSKPGTPGETEIKKSGRVMIGKRRGSGRVLPTGVVKKSRTQTPSQEGKSDAWSQYMNEVRRYKEKHGVEDVKIQSLLK